MTEAHPATTMLETDGRDCLSASAEPDSGHHGYPVCFSRHHELSKDPGLCLTQIDVNPLMVGRAGAGAKAADALVLLDPPRTTP